MLAKDCMVVEDSVMGLQVDFVNALNLECFLDICY